ncbi:MAG: queuosine precursor transporter [Candidatus Komeilibacteria bacterium]|jgi:queuosine precursor transporter|nr:queuosine precursor transporter [Candidatus Komeilibacteria bacterium]MBT4447302.1 queuosine precursor transporter [Candidatus Komeilibacteria bacterium]
MKKIFNVNQDKKILLLQALFITAMLLANIVGIKIIKIGPVNTSVGILLVPLAFLITDVLAEVKGKKFVANLIWSTVIVLIFSYLFIKLSINVEPADRFKDMNPAFVSVFNSSSRMFLASIVAFMLSQFHDIWAFEFWKEKTKGKMLWLRNNLSTMVSQFIDTVIFMFLAFYHIAPKFDAAFIWQLIVPYYLLKILIALIDTPFVYAGVKWLKKK